MGRFMSPDRMGGDPKGPDSFNKYSYTGGDPVNRGDPSGNAWACYGPQDDLSCSLEPDPDPLYWWELCWMNVGGCQQMGGPQFFQEPGGGGGGGGGISTQQGALSNAFLGLESALDNLSQDCMDNVVSKLTKGLEGFSLSGFEAYLSQGIDLQDGTTSQAGPTDVSSGAQAGAATLAQYCGAATVSAAFACPAGRKGGHVDDLTSAKSGQLTVYFRPSTVNMSNDGNNANNMSVLFHEGLHGYGAGEYIDTTIQLALFGPNSLLRRRVGAPSANINQYIKKHCF